MNKKKLKNKKQDKQSEKPVPRKKEEAVSYTHLDVYKRQTKMQG